MLKEKELFVTVQILDIGTQGLIVGMKQPHSKFIFYRMNTYWPRFKIVDVSGPQATLDKSWYSEFPLYMVFMMR